MIFPSNRVRILVATQPVDFRILHRIWVDGTTFQSDAAPNPV